MKYLQIKKIVKLSDLKKTAMAEFKQLRMSPGLNPKFFTDDELDHYISSLIQGHQEEWLIINDVDDEGTV